MNLVDILFVVLCGTGWLLCLVMQSLGGIVWALVLLCAALDWWINR
jgi:hypothetical protein